jgi:hypothetical protein
VYPAVVLTLFKQLGIDPRRETEVYHLTLLEAGVHLYGGWFHIVGTLPATREGTAELASHFSLCFEAGGAVVPAPFQPFPLVRLEFFAQVPWVLGEAYAE